MSDFIIRLLTSSSIIAWAFRSALATTVLSLFSSRSKLRGLVPGGMEF